MVMVGWWVRLCHYNMVMELHGGIAWWHYIEALHGGPGYGYASHGAIIRPVLEGKFCHCYLHTVFYFRRRTLQKMILSWMGCGYVRVFM